MSNRKERGGAALRYSGGRSRNSSTEEMVLARERGHVRNEGPDKYIRLLEGLLTDPLQKKVLTLNHNLIKKGRVNIVPIISRECGISEEEVRRVKAEGGQVILSKLEPRPR